MADADGAIVYVGQYESTETALDDFAAIQLLSKEKFIGEYEAAVFEKDMDGKVKILNTDATERGWGAKTGAITGAVLGVLFPPSIIGLAAAGAGVGAITGNMMKGLKRSDIKDMGEMLDEGTAGLVLVGFTTIEEGTERLMKKAAKVMKKEIDIEADEIKAAIDAATP